MFTSSSGSIPITFIATSPTFRNLDDQILKSQTNVLSVCLHYLIKHVESIDEIFMKNKFQERAFGFEMN